MDTPAPPLDTTPGQPTATGDWSVKEAAKLMEVSEKTVRRHVKDGVLTSHRQPGKFGEELRITAIPTALVKSAVRAESSGAATPFAASPPPDARDKEIADLKWQLGEALANMRKAEDDAKELRMALDEVRERLKLLEGPRVPWWRRFWYRVAFRGKTG
jgi:excisionase family DNA binding protein